MEVLLYIQIKPLEKIDFTTPITEWSKAELPKVMILEADNHSDEFVVNHELGIVAEAEKLAMVLDVMPEFKPGKVIPLIEKVLRAKHVYPLVFMLGENKLVEKMLKLTRAEVQSGFPFAEIVQQLNQYYS